MIIQIWAGITGVLLLVLSFRAHRLRRTLKLLRNIEVEEVLWPKVSLIIPACNEALTIESAIDSLLSIDYPNLELIVVNDRSTDHTGELIAKMQQKDFRLKRVDVIELPTGWLGKIHALEKGVQASTGEWLLFSDADVHYGPQSLRRAITYSLRKNLGFLTVIPVVHAQGVVLQSLIIQFMQMQVLGVNLQNVSDPTRRDCIGGGAFNLVRKSSYDQSEGLEWLKLDVLDDTAISLMIKRTGAKLGVLGGLDEIELEWYPNARSFVRGLEKNGFAFFQYSLIALLFFTLMSWLFFLGFTYAPFASKNLTLIFFVGVSLLFYLNSVRLTIKRVAPIFAWTVVFFPIVLPLIPLIVLRAAFLFIFHGGIYWRGTFYLRSSLIQNQRLKPIDLVLSRK